MRIQEGKHPQSRCVIGQILVHKMAVADNDGLPGQRVARKARQENRSGGDIFHGSELAIHGFSQHDILNYFLFRDPKLLGLLRDLFLD